MAALDTRLRRGWKGAVAVVAAALASWPQAAGGEPPANALPAAALRAAAAAESAAGKAVLYRDRWGVPHVYAAREEDGYFALGYAQAEDQLERLLGLVRLFRGERAAVDGAAGLGWDSFQRLWRHREEAAAGWARLEPQAQANYRSFVAGVERFMAEHPERVPANAIDLDALDLVMLPRALFFFAYQAVEGLADCLNGGVEIDPLLALPGAGAGADAGLAGTESNGWAVMPRRTADRATIVLSDPHVEIGLPIYWEYRVHAGKLHSSGFMMGALLWQAHTRDLSWAMTTGSPDVADCYELEVDPSHPRRYRFDGEWRDMEVSTTSIEVAGSSPVERSFEYTRHGGVLSPVVARKGNRAWVVSVAAMHDAGLLDQEIHRLNHAPDVASARSAMELLGMFPQTVIVGDRGGSVFYVRAGKSPRRPAGFDWSKPVDGSTSASAWQGFHVLERPHPDRGPGGGLRLRHQQRAGHSSQRRERVPRLSLPRPTGANHLARLPGPPGPRQRQRAELGGGRRSRAGRDLAGDGALAGRDRSGARHHSGSAGEGRGSRRLRRAAVALRR